MVETIERIGVCRNRALGFPALFHRLKIKLSRKYRVWPVAGDDRFLTLDPVEFSEAYETIEEFKPTNNASD